VGGRAPARGPAEGTVWRAGEVAGVPGDGHIWCWVQRLWAQWKGELKPMKSVVSVAIEVAKSQLGVKEVGTTNTGVEVDQYLASVGIEPGHAW